MEAKHILCSMLGGTRVWHRGLYFTFLFISNDFMSLLLPILGAYIAPLSGYYQFTITKQTSSCHSYFHLLIDGEYHSFHQEYDHHTGCQQQQKSSTITVKLNAGSKVQIESLVTTELYGYGVWNTHHGLYSWFCGHLLFPA